MKDITIDTPAHLHAGNIDMTGDLTRLYGTVGFTLDFPHTVIKISKSDRLRISGDDSKNAKRYAKKFIKNFNIDGSVNISIKETIPVAIGMGSQTALALSIGTGIAELYNLNIDVEDMALSLGRGTITALGVNSFRYGGFLIDGGYRIKDKGNHVPPLIFRSDIPESWLFVICIPEKPIPEILKIKEREDEILENLEPMKKELSCELSRVVLMQMMPAIMEKDIETFGKSITALNRKLGPFWDGFQNGNIYCDPIVSEGIKIMENSGAYGVCQSCWGPAFYGLLNSEKKAKNLVKRLEELLKDRGGGKVFYTRGNNIGYKKC
ncbi:MAG TPA: GHMP kinase [Candidatus Altiarchaeales archaeon]|nr:GHMP kinase [Candidatus Altiarchaeales archaeon]